jgi:predicted RNase H-like HicB family nuclease
MNTISMPVPDDVIADLKRHAPKVGFSGYQRLIRAYIGQGLRRDLAGGAGEGAADGHRSGLKLQVVLENDASGATIAHVPAIPGCRATGPTEGEAIARLREAVLASLHARNRDGMPLTVRTAEIEVAVE